MTLQKRVQLLAITGLLFMIAGVFMFLDFMGLAISLDMAKDGQNKILGAMLIFVGAVDLFVLPVLLLRQKSK